MRAGSPQSLKSDVMGTQWADGRLVTTVARKEHLDAMRWRRRGAAIDSVGSAGCVISGSVVRQSLLFNNVRVNSFSDVQQAVILPDCDIGRHCRIKKAVIGVGCQIPEGMVIGENPEDDAKRFHRTAGGVTLVTKDMLDALG